MKLQKYYQSLFFPIYDSTKKTKLMRMIGITVLFIRKKKKNT